MGYSTSVVKIKMIDENEVNKLELKKRKFRILRLFLLDCCKFSYFGRDITNSVFTGSLSRIFSIHPFSNLNGGFLVI